MPGFLIPAPPVEYSPGVFGCRCGGYLEGLDSGPFCPVVIQQRSGSGGEKCQLVSHRFEIVIHSSGPVATGVGADSLQDDMARTVQGYNGFHSHNSVDVVRLIDVPRQTVEQYVGRTVRIPLGQKRAQDGLGDVEVFVFQQGPTLENPAKEVEFGLADQVVGTVSLDDAAEILAKIKVNKAAIPESTPAYQVAQGRFAGTGRAQQQNRERSRRCIVWGARHVQVFYFPSSLLVPKLQLGNLCLLAVCG